MKRITIRRIALINCIVVIVALIIRDATNNETVSTICRWTLIIAWIIQGIYIYHKYKVT